MRAVVEAPRFLDTSQMEVDIHPRWFQAIVKGSALVMHLPEEVKPSESRVRRVTSTGWLELIMPKVASRRMFDNAFHWKRSGPKDSRVKAKKAQTKARQGSEGKPTPQTSTALWGVEKENESSDDEFPPGDWGDVPPLE